MRSRYDTTQLEAEFNNRARVPDHPRVLANWDEASALTRSRHCAALLDLPYGSGAGRNARCLPIRRSPAHRC
jgi:arylformamidase